MEPALKCGRCSCSVHQTGKTPFCPPCPLKPTPPHPTQPPTPHLEAAAALGQVTVPVDPVQAVHVHRRAAEPFRALQGEPQPLLQV